MSNGPDVQEMGRLLNKAFNDAAEAMRKFGEVWNAGATVSGEPMLSRIINQRKGKPTA